MIKKDLVTAISDKTGMSKKDSAVVLEAVISSIGNALVSGEKVKLTGFGTFSTIKKSARAGRNPQTKASITIPARTSPKFKASKVLKESVNA